jgi:hypothetical protein
MKKITSTRMPPPRENATVTPATDKVMLKRSPDITAHRRLRASAGHRGAGYGRAWARSAGSRSRRPARLLRSHAGRCRHGVLPPPLVRATLAVLSEPGPVQTMCSLAACSPALKVARAMTDPGMAVPAGLTRRDTPGSTRCRPLRAVRLPLDGQICLLAVSDPTVPGQVPGPTAAGAASRDIAPLNGRLAAELSWTTPTARGLSATSRPRHLPPGSAPAGRPRA